MKLLPKNNKGFTLIELLIVIAVIGVLAAAVLIALNPLEQFKRSRDAGLKEAISTIGRQLQGNFTLTQIYPSFATAGGWLSDMVASGELVQAPPGNGGVVTCSGPGGTGTANVQAGICYKETDSNFMIIARPEATVERQKYTPVCPAGQIWIIYQSIIGKTATLCMANANEPTVGTNYGALYK